MVWDPEVLLCNGRTAGGRDGTEPETRTARGVAPPGWLVTDILLKKNEFVCALSTGLMYF